MSEGEFEDFGPLDFDEWFDEEGLSEGELEEAVLDAFALDLERFEERAGRTLTDREVEGAFFGVLDQADRGEQPDLEVALWGHHSDAGTEPPDLDAEAGRVGYMEERIKDEAPPETYEKPLGELDLDNADERGEFINRRMRGESPDVADEGEAAA